MSLDDLTIREAKEIANLLTEESGLARVIGLATEQRPLPPASLGTMIGEKVIVRTYSAGVWYGTLTQKAGAEVIVSNARRMWRWWAAKSISLSAVAVHGIKRDKSKIAPEIASVWLEAIEIIPCTETAIESIGGAPDVEAE